jgi:hypothetical protein
MEMMQYICIHCRKELYKENEEPVVCEDHPDSPVDYIYHQQYEENLEQPEE